MPGPGCQPDCQMELSAKSKYSPPGRLTDGVSVHPSICDSSSGSMSPRRASDSMCEEGRKECSVLARNAPHRKIPVSAANKPKAHRSRRRSNTAPPKTTETHKTSCDAEKKR